MKCAFCKAELKSDQYQGMEGRDFEVFIGGVPAKVRLHDKCLGELIGIYLTGKTKGDRKND